MELGGGAGGQLHQVKETCNIGHRNLKDKPYSTQYNC